MVALFSLLIVLIVSILTTRIASVALTHTGMSREMARFQARSAFTGVGFTTKESESVVNHPLRRRIVLRLMLIGNVGIVTAISSLILGFVDMGSTSGILRLAFLLGGLSLLLVIFYIPRVDRYLSNFISRQLKKYNFLQVHDYASLLHLAGEYRVSEIQVAPDGWLAGRTLRQAQLLEEGLLVLGITRRSGNFIGAPAADTRIEEHDNLVLYGRASCIEKLESRRRGPKGDRAHDAAVGEQEVEKRRQSRLDDARGTENGNRRPADDKDDAPNP